MNEITEVVNQESDLNIVPSSSGALILDAASMDSMYRMAEIMAKGKSTIPDHLKGNVGDCMAIVMQSIQWKMNPFAVAQKTHTVNGILGYEGQLVNAVIQSSGVTESRFAYEWFGDWAKIIGKTKVIDMPAKDGKKAYQFRVPNSTLEDELGLGIRVSAILKGEIEPRVLELLLVQASVRNSPLWASDPKQQLAYLAVKRWARLFSPDVILGVYTPDEFDTSPQKPQSRNMGTADVVEPNVDMPTLLASAQATKTDDEALNFWKANNQLLIKHPTHHAEFKKVIAEHRTDLAAKEAKRTIDNTATQGSASFVDAMNNAESKEAA
ncbi:RecT family recombinase [Solimicrobium silvestre]|uniref:RecT family n=1 Tax=Solimicrobium silvestre TaxID=2099400 RepID=A0A2S9GY37_9BURK|nr:RecT family recombinase [Solimicrobium silvestre]PRC92632.1 RecT family [Solimicrobium silvestre]